MTYLHVGQGQVVAFLPTRPRKGINLLEGQTWGVVKDIFNPYLDKEQRKQVERGLVYLNLVYYLNGNSIPNPQKINKISQIKHNNFNGNYERAVRAVEYAHLEIRHKSVPKVESVSLKTDHVKVAAGRLARMGYDLFSGVKRKME